MVVVTERLLQRVRHGGACKEVLEVIRVGQRIDTICAEYLGWCASVIRQTEIDEIATQLAGVPIQGIDPYVLGSRGYGSGYVYGSVAGYGDGDAYGFGYGYGDGDAYGYGYAYGDSYGSGYGDGYGYGDGDSYGSGFGDGDASGFGES